MKGVKHTQPIPLEWHYRPHETGGDQRMRVWRNDWSGDQFEILTTKDFAKLQELAARLNIPLEQASEDD